MRFGVIVLAGIFQIFHGDRSASPRVCRREHYPSFEIGRVCAFDDASELECADRGGMSQIAVGKSEDTGTCANRCNFEFHGLTFPFDLIFAWQAVLSNRPRLHCVCWRVGPQVVNQDPHRSDEGPIPGPRGFIDNNSDWGGASPLNWRLGIRIGARNRKTGALPNGRSCRRRLACRFKFTRSGFLPGSGGAHLQEREATRSEARRGWDGVGQLPGALLHFHLGKADLRYVVKMTSDGIDPAAVTYSDAIYKSVCDL
jgi:hypothetical protein